MNRFRRRAPLRAALAVIACLVVPPSAAETPDVPDPDIRWACVDKIGADLPRYWRLVGAAGPDVKRELLVFERPLEAGPAPTDSLSQEYACRADYVREGARQVLWYARYDRSFCRSKAERLVVRLQAGGFRCFVVDGSDTFYPGAADVSPADGPVAVDSGTRPDTPLGPVNQP